MSKEVDNRSSSEIKEGRTNTTNEAYVHAVLQQLNENQTQYGNSTNSLNRTTNHNLAVNSNVIGSDNSVINLGKNLIFILTWLGSIRKFILKHSCIDSKVNYHNIKHFVSNDIGEPISLRSA